MPTPQRIPYIAGGTRERDHYQFRRSTGDLSSVPASIANQFKVATDAAHACKWVWRVKEWAVSGDVTIAWLGRPQFGVGPGQASGTVTVHINDLPLVDLRKTTGNSVFPAVPQFPTTTEIELLDNYRTPPNAVYTNVKGNFGATFQPASGVGHSPLSTFGNSIRLTASQFSLVSSSFPEPDPTNYPGVKISLNPDTPFIIDVTADVQHREPNKVYWPPVDHAQMLWTDADGIRPALVFAVTLFVRYIDRAESPGYADYDRPQQTSAQFTSSGGAFTNGLTVDDLTIPLQVSYGLRGVGGSHSLSVRPTKFWPFSTKSGAAVYDETTGAQINDPLS